MKILMLILAAMMSTMMPTERIQEDIIGTWVWEQYEDEVTVYKRADKFVADKPGIQFSAEGEILLRRNAGWCGTPPITYSNQEGSYVWDSSEELTITSKYWGGEMTHGYKIIMLKDSILKVKSHLISQ